MTNLLGYFVGVGIGIALGTIATNAAIAKLEGKRVEKK